MKKPKVADRRAADAAWLRFRLLVEWDSHRGDCTYFDCKCGLRTLWQPFDESVRRLQDRTGRL